MERSGWQGLFEGMGLSVIKVAHSKNEVAVEMMRPWLSEISVAWHNLIPLRRNRTSKSNRSELHQRRAAVSG